MFVTQSTQNKIDGKPLVDTLLLPCIKNMNTNVLLALNMYISMSRRPSLLIVRLYSPCRRRYTGLYHVATRSGTNRENHGLGRCSSVSLQGCEWGLPSSGLSLRSIRMGLRSTRVGLRCIRVGLRCTRVGLRRTGAGLRSIKVGVPSSRVSHIV
jgi:hypothetical protein